MTLVYHKAFNCYSPCSAFDCHACVFPVCFLSAFVNFFVALLIICYSVFRCLCPRQLLHHQRCNKVELSACGALTAWQSDCYMYVLCRGRASGRRRDAHKSAPKQCRFRSSVINFDGHMEFALVLRECLSAGEELVLQPFTT